MGWRALLIVGVQYKQWDPGIVFRPIDFNFFGKQAVWEMDSPINKVILIRVVQQQAVFSKIQCWETQWKLRRIIQKAGSSTTMFEIA